MKKSISSKIKEITRSETPVHSSFIVSDDSVQAELRLRVSWRIMYLVDTINYPKDLGVSGSDTTQLWARMRELANKITQVGRLATGQDSLILPLNAKTKTGAAKRAEASAAFVDKNGIDFLAAHHTATLKTTLRKIERTISSLQAQQKALLPELRKHNSMVISSRKQQKAEITARNSQALSSGEFWKAGRDALKDYFHPPFDRNYLADVSEKWRAALYTEMDSTAYKGYGGDWRHKNIGTGQAYLCGIDDNGDEWGHRLDVSDYLDHDHYGDMGYAGVTVEDAMSGLFGTEITDDAVRQGDLLFKTAKIPTADKTICRDCGQPESQHTLIKYDIDDPGEMLSCYGDYLSEFSSRTIKAPKLEPETTWEIRESHKVVSPSLRHNGVYFASDHIITVQHTSHESVYLAPGEYRLYALQIADAD